MRRVNKQFLNPANNEINKGAKREKDRQEKIEENRE